MNVSTIEHNEAVIEHFAEDPNFAELYLQTVVKDGDEAEIAEVKSWIAHSKNMAYWNNLAENAKIAVKAYLLINYSFITTLVSDYFCNFAA